MNADIQAVETLQARSAQSALIKGNTSKGNYCLPGTVWVNDECSRSTRLHICCPDLYLIFMSIHLYHLYDMEFRTKCTVRMKESMYLPSKIQC